MLFSCPGSGDLKRPKPQEVKCPGCGEGVEVWSDEVSAVCPKCRTTVMRTQGPSCLDWCQHAQECVGPDKYEKYVENKAVSMKEKLLKELELYFGSDTKRIAHARKVMGFAEELLRQEQADWHIVIPASILHDVGIKAAEAKYGSSAGKLQEKEGPQIARRILLEAGVKAQDVDQICAIIAHHHSPGKINTRNFQVLYDADWLVNLKDEAGLDDKKKIEAVIEKVFLTEAGKKMAKAIYLTT